MAVVTVESRITFWGGVVSCLSCSACMGTREVVNENGLLLFCAACHGTGMLNMEAERAYAKNRSDRFRSMGLRRRFDGRD